MGNKSSKGFTNFFKDIGRSFGISGDAGQVLTGFIQLPGTIFGKVFQGFFGGIFSGVGGLIIPVVLIIGVIFVAKLLF